MEMLHLFLDAPAAGKIPLGLKYTTPSFKSVEKQGSCLVTAMEVRFRGETPSLILNQTLDHLGQFCLLRPTEALRPSHFMSFST